MIKPDWRDGYDEDREEYERSVTRIDNDGKPSLTQQHHTDEVDINKVLKRFGVKDGSIDLGTFDGSVLANPNLFGDFTEAPDLKDVLDISRAAAEGFMQLPASVRRRFDNNPAELHRFMTDPTKVDEAIELGLLKRDPVPIPELGSKERPLYTRAPEPVDPGVTRPPGAAGATPGP